MESFFKHKNIGFLKAHRDSPGFIETPNHWGNELKTVRGGWQMRPKELKIEAGGWVWWGTRGGEHIQPFQNLRQVASPYPPVGVWGVLQTLRAGFGAKLQLSKGFPLFSALRMASPNTIMLLNVDHTKKWKILIPFNLESIIVHLVMLCDFFSHSRKVK